MVRKCVETDHIFQYHSNNIIIIDNFSEKSIRCDNPLELPLLIAKAKAEALLIRLRALNTNESSLILTSDQIVLFDGKVREKPVDVAEATFFLSSYSDTCVATVSAVVITEFPSGVQTSGVDVAKVHWKSISDEVVAKVVAKGEIFSSAGGFRIEDEDLNPLVARIEGSVDSVMGLPVDLTAALLQENIRLLSSI